MANDIILISELPGCYGGKQCDLTVVVQGGVTKQAKVSLYPTSENLTASQVRDLLMTLIDNARLPKNVYKGSRFCFKLSRTGGCEFRGFSSVGDDEYTSQ